MSGFAESHLSNIMQICTGEEKIAYDLITKRCKSNGRVLGSFAFSLSLLGVPAASHPHAKGKEGRERRREKKGD